MKTTSKLYQVAGLPIALLIGATSLTLPAGAVGVTQAMDSGTKTSSACLHITTLQSTNETNVATKKATMQSDFAARLAKVTTDESQTDQKVATYRANLVSNFDAKVAKLDTQKGITTAQTAAVATYKASMLAAETTRENSVDTARHTYRADLSAAISGRQTALTDAVNSFQSGMTSAFATAVNTCGTDSSALTTLRASIKAARQDMQTTMADNKIATTIQQDAATRKAAVQTADQAFVQAAKGFSQTLVQALGASN